MSNEINKDELLRMKQLMSYGLNESSKKNSQSIVEYHQVGADGNTYGIIKENNKFYIKVAPKKDTEILAEDYDYIGGFMNKKQHEYDTYTIASKQFGLKMKSLNEANASSKVSISPFKEIKDAEWQINETREMRNEINRFKQITNNISYILSENKEGLAIELGSPEKDAEEGNPFVEKPMSTDKINNMKEDEKDPKKADDTFSDKGEYKEEIKGNEHTDPKTADDTYNKGVKSVESEGVSVATVKGTSNKNDKGVKMNESKHRKFKVTEEQVLAWNDALNYMDTSKGTEIGDTAPYDEELPKEQSNQDMNEDVVHNTENMNQHMGEKGDSAPFDEKVNGAMSGRDLSNSKVYEVELDDETGLPVDSNTTMLTDDGENDYELDIEDNFDDEREFDAEPIMETKLNVFGKHPAYQKVPMTTPDNREIDRWGRDWNDDSAKGERPFGIQIGHSGDPFSEKIIDMLTDAVMESLKKKD